MKRNINVEKEFISVPASRYDDDDDRDHDQIKVTEQNIKGTIHKFFLYPSTVSNFRNSKKNEQRFEIEHIVQNQIKSNPSKSK